MFKRHNDVGKFLFIIHLVLAINLILKAKKIECCKPRYSTSSATLSPSLNARITTIGLTKKNTVKGKI